MNSTGAVVKSHHESYIIRAGTHEERKEWVHALESNILSNPLTELINMRRKQLATDAHTQQQPRAAASSITASTAPTNALAAVNFAEVSALLALCQAAAKGGYTSFREKHPDTITLLVSHGTSCYVLANSPTRTHTIVMHVTPTEPAKDIRPLMLLCRTSTQLLASSNFRLEDHLNLHKVLPEQLRRLQGVLEPDYALVLVGHSLGGVAALRLALMLSQAGRRVNRVLTFGQPRFLTDKTVAATASALPVLRVIDSRDVVHFAYPLAQHVGAELTLLPDTAVCYSERPRDREIRTTQLEAAALSSALACHTLDSFARRLAPKLSGTLRLVSETEADKMAAAEPVEVVGMPHLSPGASRREQKK